MPRSLIYCAVLLVLALGLNLSTSLPNPRLNGTDIIDEYYETRAIINMGWNPLITQHNNNTSIVVGLLVPALSKMMTPLKVYKIILPIIFSATPLLLYLLYRKFTTNGIAFIGALFFTLLPPTWQEVPTIGKSTIAEPLAVLSLIVVFTNLNNKIKIPILTLLITITALAHYTVGFMLLGWVICIAVVESIIKKKMSGLSIPIILSGMLIAIWYSIASNGVIFYEIFHRGIMNADPLVPRLLFQSWFREGFMVKIQIVLMYIALFIMGMGVYWIALQFKQIDKRIITAMGLCALGIIIRVVFTEYTGFLLLTRWVQYGSIFLSLLFAFGIQQCWRMVKRKSYMSLTNSD